MTATLDASVATGDQAAAGEAEVGPERDQPVTIRVFDYNADGVEEHDGASISTCVDAAHTPERTWISVDGIHDAEMVTKLAEDLHIHPLVIEDILNPVQRPKVDEAEEYLYLVLKALDWDPEKRVVTAQQVSIVLGPCFLVSFEEQPSDLLEVVRHRLRSAHSHLREQGTDFLAHAIVDAVVDQYFTVLEAMSTFVEEVQDQLLQNPSRDDLGHVHGLKRCLAFVRQTTWPLREAVNGLTRSEHPLVSDKVDPYFRDVYDNVISVIDNVEVQREVVSSLLELYLSSLSNRLNETMKVLTVISAIFVPLTFVAGVYGMNFQHMPELGWRWGYAIVLIFMTLVGVFEVRFFRRKGWI